MAKKLRAVFAGATNYTAVPLAELVAHLKTWKTDTDACVSAISNQRTELLCKANLLTRPEELDSYVNLLLSSFTAYSGELDRLLRELPAGVKISHAEALRQIQRQSWGLDDVCRRLRDEVFTEDESVRYGPIEKVYCESRSLIQDYLDLSNLATRLEVLEGQQCSRPIGMAFTGSAKKICYWALGILTALIVAWLTKMLGLS